MASTFLPIFSSLPLPTHLGGAAIPIRSAWALGTMLTSFKDKDEVLLPGTDQMQQGGTFWGGARSQQIYQLGGVLHDFSGLPAASGRWIPGLPTGDGSAALEPPCEGKKNGKFTAKKKGLERCPLLRHRLRRAGRGDDRMHSLF